MKHSADILVLGVCCSREASTITNALNDVHVDMFRHDIDQLEQCTGLPPTILCISVIHSTGQECLVPLDSERLQHPFLSLAHVTSTSNTLLDRGLEIPPETHLKFFDVR